MSNKKEGKVSKQRGFKQALPFLLPGSILLIIFLIVPFFFAFYLSFTNTRLISPIPPRFIGFDNYIRLFKDDLFGRALLNNFYFVGVVVPIQTIFALSLAILVNQKLKLSTTFRTIYFLPTVTTLFFVAESEREI